MNRPASTFRNASGKILFETTGRKLTSDTVSSGNFRRRRRRREGRGEAQATLPRTRLLKSAPGWIVKTWVLEG
jgi:hypothetical protein